MGAAAVTAFSIGGASAAADWLPSWSASPQPVWAPDSLPPVLIPRALRDQTLRRVARISLGGHHDEAKEAKRQALNAFIRGGAFDGVIDFDAVVRDPADPKHIRADYEHGEHLHPNDTGYKAMADAIELDVLGVH